MNNKLFLAMFAAAGVIPAVAAADFPVQKTKMVASSPTDFARITAAQGDKPGRLRRTDSEQPGNEQPHFAMFGGANAHKGLFFVMNTDLVDPDCTAAATTPDALEACSYRAPNRIQLAMVPFELVQDPASKAVAVKANYTGLRTNTAATGGARFVTNNDGNEYRNANHPEAFRIADNVICVLYNYQANNDTRRYTQCFDPAGKRLLNQTQFMAKNNDDCAMTEAGGADIVEAKSDGVAVIGAWGGCNGNGSDDGWAFFGRYTIDNLEAPTKVTFQKTGDVSLAAREERSHGRCTFQTDGRHLACSWTEGNTQPQRDGVWLAMVDSTKSGNAAIVWKQQIERRVELPNGERAYAMRAMSDRIFLPSTAGELERTDMIFYRYGTLRGNNRNNGRKGGYYAQNMMGVIEITAQGPKYVMPMTDMSGKLLGMDATHLVTKFGVVGTSDALKPALMLVSGNMNAGSYGAQMHSIVWDRTANALTKGESREVAPYDIHLYSNYLGNNPGNQGRNFGNTLLVKNPFATTDAGDVTHLMIVATTGKDPADAPTAECLDCAKRKLSAYLTVVPVAENPPAENTGGTGGEDPGTGGGDQGGEDPGTGEEPVDPTAPADPGATLGGCSAAGGAGTGALLLLGLVGLIRRRK